MKPLVTVAGRSTVLTELSAKQMKRLSYDAFAVFVLVGMNQ